MTKQIEGYSKYTVNEQGEVFSSKWDKKRKLKPQRASQSKKGYVQVRLFNKEYPKGRLQYIHRIVWETFKGEIPSGMEIDHIDGNPLNNNIDNLQVLSRRNNNLKHIRETQKYLLRDNREQLCKDYDTLGTFKKVAEKWGVSFPAVWRVIRNQTHTFNKNKGKYSTKVYDKNISDKWTVN